MVKKFLQIALTVLIIGFFEIIHTASACFQEAGGLPAEGPKVVVLNAANLTNGDDRTDPYIEHGDVVIVVESNPVYIVGQVQNPRVLYAKDSVTLPRAIAMAGGVTNMKKPVRIVIYRLGANGRYGQYLKAELSEITKHSSRDPILQPYDIVDVGASGRLIPPRYQIFGPRPSIPLQLLTERGVFS